MLCANANGLRGFCAIAMAKGVCSIAGVQITRAKRPGISRISFNTSGAAYDFALILDADSLMEGETIVEMVRRMQAEP